MPSAGVGGAFEYCFGDREASHWNFFEEHCSSEQPRKWYAPKLQYDTILILAIRCTLIQKTTYIKKLIVDPGRNKEFLDHDSLCAT
jgi:hypothetical protein